MLQLRGDECIRYFFFFIKTPGVSRLCHVSCASTGHGLSRSAVVETGVCARALGSLLLVTTQPVSGFCIPLYNIIQSFHYFFFQGSSLACLFCISFGTNPPGAGQRFSQSVCRCCWNLMINGQRSFQREREGGVQSVSYN